VGSLIATARQPIARRAFIEDAARQDEQQNLHQEAAEIIWHVTPEILADELNRLPITFGREILAAQLRHQGSGNGPIAGLISEIDRLLARYDEKIDGLAGRAVS
jgi:hypothetical protein